MVEHDYSKLISEAGEIYESHRKKSADSGSNFNVFDTIGITRDENRFSSFIAELLNPRGSHDREHKFLRVFLEMMYDRKPYILGSEFQVDDIIKNIQVETEQFHIVENQAGRIDIIVENSDYAIVIENKIDAGDRDYQLWRYWQSKKNKKGIMLVYLTLDGRLPESKSLTLKSMNGEEGLDDTQIVCMSYQEHILKWLEACNDDSPEKIAVVINHFIQNIKNITNQEGNTEMKQELANMLLNGNNLKYADEIAKAASLVRAQLEYSFFKKIKERLDIQAKEFGFTHCLRVIEIDKIEWNWDSDKATMIELIRNQNYRKGAVRLFYKNSENEVFFIADGLGQKDGFWYGLISTRKIPENIEQILKKREGSTIKWGYYHDKLPLWEDGIYHIMSDEGFNQHVDYAVNDILMIMEQISK